MYTASQLAVKYLRYFFTASNGRGHGIHSPFVYEFIREVLMDRNIYPAYKKAELYRAIIAADNTMLDVVDLGAGSVLQQKEKKRKVSAIAGISVKPKRYSRLLYRIAEYYHYRNMIELGTSLGVTTTYLAETGNLENLVTMEGADAIADYAETWFRKAKLQKVKLVRGNFDDTLEVVLQGMDTVDLAFVDGNHRKEPTLRYFNSIKSKINENSCIIFDDIHWSAEMEEAWAEIKADPGVRLSIDLFFVGIVFFRQSFVEKQDFTIRF
jgi:predicted O-methyltransferase YrrM